MGMMLHRHFAPERETKPVPTEQTSTEIRKIKPVRYKGERVAVYTGTRNLYRGMVSAYKSLIANSNVDRIYLLIEDDEFPYELPDKVKIINVSGQTVFPQGGPNMYSGFTYMALIRSTYALMFPNLDRILSLDVDTIVMDDVSELWDIPLDGYYFSASIEPHKSSDVFTYTNIGVTMYNLKALRDGKAEEVIQELNTRQYNFVEQDVFNLKCQGHILPMDGDYNSCPFTVHGDNPKIRHYAGDGSWMDKPLVKEWLEK